MLRIRLSVQWWFCIALIFAMQQLSAQVTPDTTVQKTLSNFSTDLFRFDSIRADSTKYVVSAVSFYGNKITKQFILEREMMFHVGDTLSGAQFVKLSEQSRRNLLNTSLFNFVTVNTTVPYDSAATVHEIIVVVNVKERWYTWPAPIFEVAEQNFNTWWRNGHNLQRATYGFYLWQYNFRGRKESVALICRFGYARQFGGQYAIPYLNRRRTLGVTFTGLYTQSHEVAYATRDNLLLFYKDRIHFIRNETSASILFSYRQGIYVTHTLDFRYTNLFINDTVTRLASDYFVDSDHRMQYFSASYHVVRDYRDIKAYPLKGHLEELEITKHGLGLLPTEKLDVFYVAVGLRKYAELVPRWFGAVMFRGRWMPGAVPPYYHQRALGFGSYVRGYEYYVIDGQSYALGKLSLRYQLLKPHVFTIPYFPMEKFNTFHLAVYTGLFADAAYVDDRASVLSDHNYLGNTTLFGYGAGIDLVTYYDVVVRVEYSFNRQGESGFFLHFGAGI